MTAGKDAGSREWKIQNSAPEIVQRRRRERETRENAPKVDAAALCAFLKKGQADLLELLQQAKSEGNPLRQANAGEAFKRKREELKNRLNTLVAPDFKFEGTKGVVSGIEAQVYAQGPAANLWVSLPDCPVKIAFRFIDSNGQWGNPGSEFTSLSRWRSVLESVVSGTPVIFSAVILKNGSEQRYYFPGPDVAFLDPSQVVDTSLGLSGLIVQLRKDNRASGGEVAETNDPTLTAGTDNQVTKTEPKSPSPISGDLGRLNGEWWEGDCGVGKLSSWKVDGDQIAFHHSNGNWSVEKVLEKLPNGFLTQTTLSKNRSTGTRWQYTIARDGILIKNASGGDETVFVHRCQ